MNKFNKIIFTVFLMIAVFSIGSNAKAADWTCNYYMQNYIDSDIVENRQEYLTFTVKIKNNKISSLSVKPDKTTNESFYVSDVTKYLNIDKFVTKDGKSTCPAKIYTSYCAVAAPRDAAAVLDPFSFGVTEVVRDIRDLITGEETSKIQTSFQYLLSSHEIDEDIINNGDTLKYCTVDFSRIPNRPLTYSAVGENGIGQDTGIKTGTAESPDETSPQKPDVSKTPTNGCGFIGPKTLEIIEWIVKVIRIVVPVLVLILGILDFVRAMFSGEDKTFKECGGRFIKRLIAAIILIFLPYILSFLINISGITDDYDINPDNMFCAFF